MDNPKRAEVGLVHPGTASQQSRSGRNSVEVVETVAQKKDGLEQASDSGISVSAPACYAVLPVRRKNLRL